MHLPIKILDWDSKFFGKRIASVTTSCLSSDIAKQICSWAENEGIDCIYYLASGVENNATESAEETGFHFIDLRVTFVKDLSRLERKFIPKYHIRRAGIEDLQYLISILKVTFLPTRFKVDQKFDPVRVDKMYETWLEKDLTAVGHKVWVIEMENQIASFCSVSSTETGNARIGLVGSSRVDNGLEYFLSLQEFLFYQLKNEGFEFIEVITQGRNIEAQKKFQHAGYLIDSIDLWYHKWF